MGQEAGREAGQVPGLVTLEVEAQAAGIFRLCVLGVLSTCVLSTEREPLGAGPAYCARGPPLLLLALPWRLGVQNVISHPRCLLPCHCPSCLSFRFLPLTSLPCLGLGSLPPSHARQ